jgi:hypothetical protein
MRLSEFLIEGGLLIKDPENWTVGTEQEERYDNEGRHYTSYCTQGALKEVRAKAVCAGMTSRASADLYDEAMSLLADCIPTEARTSGVTGYNDRQYSPGHMRLGDKKVGHARVLDWWRTAVRRAREIERIEDEKLEEFLAFRDARALHHEVPRLKAQIRATCKFQGIAVAKSVNAAEEELCVAGD